MRLSFQFKKIIKICLFAVLFFAAGSIFAAEQEQSRQSQNTTASQRRGRMGFSVQGVYKTRITPNWFAENTRFWYRNDLSGDTKEFILVDAEKGTRQKAFDHLKLAEALSKATDEKYTAAQLPFNYIEFVDNDNAILFNVNEKTWKCNLSTYEVSPSKEELTPPEESARSRFGPGGRRGGQGRGRFGRQNRQLSSPDEKWNAYIKNNNVFIREGEDGEEIQLSKDGEENNTYTRLEWAPNSKSIIAWRREPGDHKEVYLIQSSPPGGGRAVMQSRPYDLPGDKLDAYELNIFDVENRKQIKPELERVDLDSPQPHWNNDDYHVMYEKVDRGHQRLRVIEVNTKDGSWRNLIDEKTDTFIWTAHTESLGLSLVTYLDKTDEIIYVSEMDGWRHIYLVDIKQGKISNQITKGPWVVRGIDLIDEDARQIWFNAGGKNPDQDPYFLHYYRVNFDGTGLVELTEGNGNHSVQYSPDRKYIIDTYSQVDMAPVHELRRTSDGSLVCELEKRISASCLQQDGNLRKFLSPRDVTARRISGASSADPTIWIRTKSIRSSKISMPDRRAHSRLNHSAHVIDINRSMTSALLLLKWTAWEQPIVPRHSMMYAGKTSRTQAFPTVFFG